MTGAGLSQRVVDVVVVPGALPGGFPDDRPKPGRDRRRNVYDLPVVEVSKQGPKPLRIVADAKGFVRLAVALHDHGVGSSRVSDRVSLAGALHQEM